MLPPRRTLRRTSGLATALVALLGAQIALIAAEIIARFLQADQLRSLQATGLVTQQQLDTSDGWVSGIAAIGGLAFLATVVVWCIWQHHAQGNAVVLSGGGLHYTPGWAVGWWFIPIANLWKPFQTVRELWKASHGGGWRTIATWSLLGWWWATWLAGSLNVQLGSNTRFGILFGSSVNIDQVSIGEAIAEDRWRVVWLAFRLVAAALAIVIVRSVERLQTAAAEAGGGSTEPVAVLPAPPQPTGADALPPPPPMTPTVDDAIPPGERTFIIAVVVGALLLSIGGQVWVGRDHTGDATGADPSRTGLPASSASPASPGPANTYAQHGVRFLYPASWSEGPTSTSGSVGSPPEWTDGFSPPGATNYDIVIVSAYELNGDAGSLNTTRQEALVEHLTKSLLASLNGSLNADVSPVAIGTDRGYHALLSVTLQGVPIEVDFNVLFHGSQEYTIVCQSTASATATVADGCKSIRGTFQVTGTG
ncbi:MAG TPA: DUF4328 domain-containing protein [Actinomycetota bacterium]|nr:DUF4328 domain-containing protein [Actinomycetota bacterium]